MDKNKELLSAQKATLKIYPGAIAARDEFGKWYIYHKEQDIFEEFFFPHTDTEFDAWKCGSLTAKTMQNFNRTHPNKLDLEVSEAKTSRIRRRKEESKELCDDSHIF